MTMGERIKLLRKGKFSQEELADLLDVHVNTLIKWEHDKGYPTADKLKVLAKTLGTTVAYILGETDDLTPLKVENDSRNDVDLPNEESPYVKEQQKLNKGMLVYTFKNGEKVEMPPIKASYDFLRDVALGVARVAVL